MLNPFLFNNLVTQWILEFLRNILSRLHFKILEIFSSKPTYRSILCGAKLLLLNKNPLFYYKLLNIIFYKNVIVLKWKFNWVVFEIFNSL